MQCLWGPGGVLDHQRCYHSHELLDKAAWELNSATLEEQDRYLGPGSSL